MATGNKVRYGSRTFGEYKLDLMSIINETYPDVFSDFSDSNVGSMLIDLNAGIANNLSVNTDRIYQETTLEYAQQRASILNIAKNMGFNIPNKRPSVTVIDFSVQVPRVTGDKPDPDYLPIIAAGAQVVGGGKIFETQNNIDFSMYNSNLLSNNKMVVPNYNSNGNIISYTITKREVVTNGSSSVYKRVINASDIIPFFSVTLPDLDVIEIDSVVLVEGTNSQPDFDSLDNKYYEVDYLAQQSVAVEDIYNITNGIKAIKWIQITKKFITELTVNGYTTLTFGSGDNTIDFFKDGMIKMGVDNKEFLNNFLNNTSLGEKLKPNYTLFVKYRVGGGSSSNIGAGTLTQLGNFTMSTNGSDDNINQNIKRSLKVNNPIPAIGGNDGLSVEQIRQLIKYNFASQNRCVTLSDYLVQLYKMNGKFGSPYRANVHKENNKIIISILGIGSDGKLSNTSNSVLKDNISEYLSKFRTINDYIEVRDGRVINLGFEVKLYVKNISDKEILVNVIKIISEYFDISKQDMNQDIFLSDLEKKILDVNGVINTIYTKAFNNVGNQYSLNTVSQELVNETTREIKIINNTLFSDGDSMFEVKYPDKDIKIILVKSSS